MMPAAIIPAILHKWLLKRDTTIAQTGWTSFWPRLRGTLIFCETALPEWMV